MIKLRRVITTLILALTATTVALGQNVTWSVVPSTTYDRIEMLSPTLYKVYKDNKVGLMDAQGNIISPVNAYGITGFYDGYAILYTITHGLKTIIGVVDTNGNFTPFKNAYHCVKNQEFFSEGLVTVFNDRQDLGYVDVRGNEIIGFNGIFTDIKPFSEGYAVVFDKSRHPALIDKRCSRVPIITGSNSDVAAITNMYNGKAYVIDNSSTPKFYLFDANTRKVSKTSNPGIYGFADIDDYLYYPSKLSHRPTSVPTTEPDVQKSGPRPYEMDSKYGYRYRNIVLTPAIYTEAEPFYGEYAIAKTNRGTGILYFNEDAVAPGGFSVTAPGNKIMYSAGKSVECKYTTSIPEPWASQPITIETYDADSGEKVPCRVDGNTVTFDVKPTQKNQTNRYEVNIRYGSNLLHSQEIAYTFEKKADTPRISVSIAVSGTRANEKDVVPVTVTVTNNGEETVTTTVNVSGSPSLAEVSKSVTIEPGRSAQVHTYFRVERTLTNQTVNASTTKGGSATRTVSKLDPYY